MFRNLILPGIVVVLLALTVSHPAFAHDTLHKKLLAVAVIVGPALLIRLVIAAKGSQKPAPRSATPYAAPAKRGR